MRIAIIGTGKMGRGFAQALAPTHEVIVGSRDPQRANAVAAKTRAAGGATYAAASAQAEVIILAVPWQAMDDTLGQFGDVTGTVVIDVSFPHNKQQREALRGRSTAEVIQQRLPKARVSRVTIPRQSRSRSPSRETCASIPWTSGHCERRETWRSSSA